MSDYLKVTQVRSAIGRQGYQRKTLLGLGIKRRGRTAFVQDSPSVRGMVAAVSHLVVWEEATAADREAALTSRTAPSYEVVGAEAEADVGPATEPEEEGEDA